MELTKKEARRLMLYHQGLLAKSNLKGKDGIMTFIKKVGCLQYDPLNVIALNPHLVLQSRINDYKIHQLNGLLYKDRLLMDGWDKCMSIYPIEDRPYFKRHFESAWEEHSHRDEKILKSLPIIRKKIEAFGPSTSKDIAMIEKIDWWWAPTSVARAVLDLMFFTGELTIFNKIGTRKVYDFSVNHLPDDLLLRDDPNPETKDYFAWGLLRRINAQGILWDKRSESLLGIKGLKTDTRKNAFKQLLDQGVIVQFHIKDIDADFYMTKELFKQYDNSQKNYHRRIFFLAPLDNMLWDRAMIKSIFDFEYKWEVYTPKAQRKYGYYVLPILFGDTFIGRFEPRYDEKTKILKLLNIWLETKEKNFEKPLIKAIKVFGKFLGATSIELDVTSATYDTLTKLFPLEELNG